MLIKATRLAAIAVYVLSIIAGFAFALSPHAALYGWPLTIAAVLGIFVLSIGSVLVFFVHQPARKPQATPKQTVNDPFDAPAHDDSFPHSK